ncbi:MAG: sugar-binding transcriptional regulator [Geminicoccaceae bacterium]
METMAAIANVASARDHKITNTRLRAAYMYYVEGMTQNEIADRLGVGRVTVVRHLNEARRRREVRFEVDGGIGGCVHLEMKLESRFGLDKAVVAPDSGDPSTINSLVGFCAGAYLSELLDDGLSIGVGWGQTLVRSLVTLAPRTLKNASVVSLLGGVYQARDYNPSEFAWQMASTIGAECFLFPAPVLVDSAETRKTLLDKCGLSRVVERARNADIAVVSVGSMDTSSTALNYCRDMLDGDIRQELIEAGAVGDLFFNFFDAGGQIIDHPINDRVMNVPVPDLRNIPQRVLVAGGRHKLQAIRAALGMIQSTALITNEDVARLLVES